VSNPSKPGRPANPVINMLGALDGAELPGGCASCDAYQRVRNAGGGVFVIDVYHDDDCPVLAAKEASQ
jgi:hypothetical protein